MVRIWAWLDHLSTLQPHRRSPERSSPGTTGIRPDGWKSGHGTNWKNGQTDGKTYGDMDLVPHSSSLFLSLSIYIIRIYIYVLYMIIYYMYYYRGYYEVL